MGLSMSCATTAARIAHQFDIRGPVSSYDTACSASLVAMNAAHLCMFDSDPPKPDNAEALVVGVNTLLGPGREGCGAVFVKMYQGDKQDEEDRVCALIGTATNQDGRSASLTAPNGPAQQQVIKKSMRFAGINPNTVSIAECHGTGTALGDPIEVGALMAVMHERKVPILKTSAKSNIAHLEAGAGIAGLTKCIMMINMGTAPPNCHFNLINPHLTIEGYPVRADVYGWASKGHKAAVKANLPSHSLPRALHMGQKLYVSGSWDNFSSHKVMDGGRDGRYSVVVRVDESEFELPQNVKLGVGDTYFSGKLLARMARLVAIADELGLSNEAFVNRMLTELADTLGNKDWFMGFSWAGGIKFEPLGRNQESVSEAINSYYAIACYGTILMKRGGEAKELGVQLRQLGRLFTAMEAPLPHVRPQAEILSNYPHPTVGIMWEHVALHQTWFGGAGWAVEGIQMLPVIPVLEDFLKKDWVQNHFLQYQDSCENDPSCKHLGWSWLVCIQQAVLSVEDAPAASGNSLTNSLYWFATRDERPDVEPWPVAQAQVITTPQPDAWSAGQTPQDFGPIHKFGHHGVRMNNNCFKNNDVACPKVPPAPWICVAEPWCQTSMAAKWMRKKPWKA
eukprot:g31110.t1